MPTQHFSRAGDEVAEHQINVDRFVIAVQHARSEMEQIKIRLGIFTPSPNRKTKESQTDSQRER